MFLLRERQVELGILDMCVSACVWPVSMLVTLLLGYMLRKYGRKLGCIAENGVW